MKQQNRAGMALIIMILTGFVAGFVGGGGVRIELGRQDLISRCNEHYKDQLIKCNCYRADLVKGFMTLPNGTRIIITYKFNKTDLQNAGIPG